MELWIRSQDKLTMLKVNDIKIIDYRGLKEQLKNSPLSFLSEMEQMKGYLDKDGWGLSCNETCLGIYETKERALEVLDKIEKHLIKAGTSEINVDENGIPNGMVYYPLVYEMPKE